MGCPTSVGDRDLGDERLGGVHTGLCDALAKTSDLANLLVEDGFVGLVTIDAYAGRIVASVLKTRQTIAKGLADAFTVLKVDS